MGHPYRAVAWNRQKRIYDTLLASGVALYLVAFVGIAAAVDPQITPETATIRAFGTGAFLLLHVVLCIGPLCRLDARFLPLLYNRRHMGVTLFLLASVHGTLSFLQFHALGSKNPFVSLFTSNSDYASLSDFPFQPLGAVALVVLFLMATTSHDFWLTNLGAPVWKALHMSVYGAYGLLVMHVTLGALQVERSPVLPLAVGAGLVAVLSLHLLAAFREAPLDRDAPSGPADRQAGEVRAPAGFVDAGAVADIAEGRARVVTVAGDRVAVFRHDGCVSAVSNACQHQNGPLGEGRIVDGCITCPWHGYQYDPRTGASPAPFTERVPTFDVRVAGGRVFVADRPNPAGTPVEPARIGAT